MKIELKNKVFKLKETQFIIDHDHDHYNYYRAGTTTMSERVLGLEGQKVILINKTFTYGTCDEVAAVQNVGESERYYTLFSNLLSINE